MRFIRHFGHLLGDVLGYARKNKAYWIVPVVFLLLLMALLVFAGQSVAPFIYTLF